MQDCAENSPILLPKVNPQTVFKNPNEELARVTQTYGNASTPILNRALPPLSFIESTGTRVLCSSNFDTELQQIRKTYEAATKQTCELSKRIEAKYQVLEALNNLYEYSLKMVKSDTDITLYSIELRDHHKRFHALILKENKNLDEIKINLLNKITYIFSSDEIDSFRATYRELTPLISNSTTDIKNLIDAEEFSRLILASKEFLERDIKQMELPVTKVIVKDRADEISLFSDVNLSNPLKFAGGFRKEEVTELKSENINDLNTEFINLSELGSSIEVQYPY